MLQSPIVRKGYFPGRIMVEMIQNSRVVGCNDTAIRSKIVDFYRSFVEGEVLETPTKTAEMCKLVENSYRDVNIAFANELSILCDEDGIDVWELIESPTGTLVSIFFHLVLV